MTTDIDDKLASSLAIAVTRYPRASLQRLTRRQRDVTPYAATLHAVRTAAPPTPLPAFG